MKAEEIHAFTQRPYAPPAVNLIYPSRLKSGPVSADGDCDGPAACADRIDCAGRPIMEGGAAMGKAKVGSDSVAGGAAPRWAYLATMAALALALAFPVA